MNLESRLLRTAGALCERFPFGKGTTGKLTILIYHSVSSAPELLGHSDVEIDIFDRHLQVLTQVFTVLPLSEAVARLRYHTLPANAACITFDDGYRDNYTVALPVLQRYGLHATFFVASAYLGGGRMFNDAIIETIRECALPCLDLSRLGLGSFNLDGISARATAISRLLREIKPMPLDAREDCVEAIARAAGVTLKSDLMMTYDEVARLADAGMEVGSHTHRHPILASLSDEEAANEIRFGKSELERIVGREVKLFAYPNGRPGVDYTLRHAHMLRDIGFVAGVSTAVGTADYSADPFQLPRFTPWDRGTLRFLARLARTRKVTSFSVAS